jgi:hypothetical protein
MGSTAVAHFGFRMLSAIGCMQLSSLSRKVSNSRLKAVRVVMFERSKANEYVVMCNTGRTIEHRREFLESGIFRFKHSLHSPNY